MPTTPLRIAECSRVSSRGNPAVQWTLHCARSFRFRVSAPVRLQSVLQCLCRDRSYLIGCVHHECTVVALTAFCALHGKPVSSQSDGDWESSSSCTAHATNGHKTLFTWKWAWYLVNIWPSLRKWLVYWIVRTKLAQRPEFSGDELGNTASGTLWNSCSCVSSRVCRVIAGACCLRRLISVAAPAVNSCALLPHINFKFIDPSTCTYSWERERKEHI